MINFRIATTSISLINGDLWWCASVWMPDTLTCPRASQCLHRHHNRIG